MPGPDRLPASSRWVTGDSHAGDTVASQRLFCFAHAGGGPSFFRSWPAGLAPDISVSPVLLPGREMRLAEPPFRHIAELVEPLGLALEPFLDLPYAFFGHSLGAVIAYEVARWLSARSAMGPACLLVSGRLAPAAAPPRRQISALPDDQFVAQVQRLNGVPPEVLSEPELLGLLLPVLRADFEIAETYQPLPGGRLDCPVVAYLSTSDPDVGYAGVLGWREVTNDGFSVRVFRGDHFYVKGGRTDVLAAVREDLRAGTARLSSRTPQTVV